MNKSADQIIDPVIVKHFTEHPLSAFSLYTEVQFRVLKEVGKNVIDSLDNAFKDSHLEGETLHGFDPNEINKAYGLFWLWVLGAFELIRTMSGANKCFKSVLLVKLVKLKKHLAIIRMPFSKQQPRGRKEPIKGEASICNIDGEKRDICFCAEGSQFWVREEIRSFEALIEAINIDDIVSTYNASYELQSR